MIEEYTFPCGCKFKQCGTTINETGLPSLDIDLYNLPHCPPVYKMLQEGKTKGVFQLETSLGHTWCKKLVPNNINDIAALISIIRPGVLKSMLDNKSMTQHFCDRKNGKEDVTPLDPALTEILRDTYQIQIYQEDSIRIAMEIAGFNEVNADKLRKAIGTKDAEIMANLETEFIEGCKNVGKVSDTVGKQLFDWIRESQKYSFNASHAVSYATIGYQTGYVKYHFPLQFFTSWLHHAKEKIDPHAEIRQLVSEAKLFDINIYVPSIKYITEFNGKICIKNKSIFLGLENIKSCGGAAQLKIIEEIKKLEKEKLIDKFEWLDILVRLLPNLRSTAVKNMILCGVFDVYGISRAKMLFDYQTVSELTKKELSLLQEYYNTDFIYSLIVILDKCTKKRQSYVDGLIKALQNPPTDLKDTVTSIINNEKEILGVALSSNYLDSSTESWSSNTCRDYLNGNTAKVSLSVEIKDIRPYKIKSGKNQGREMGYIVIEDNTASIDGVKVFCDTWNSQRSLFYVGAHLLLTGEKSKYDDSLVIYSAKEI